MAVKISDVVFDGIQGTSASEDAIELNCSETYGCTGIVLNNVNISPVDPSDEVYASCTNVHGTFTGTKPAINCPSS